MQSGPARRKAVKRAAYYGMAESVPFVRRSLPQPLRCLWLSLARGVVLGRDSRDEKSSRDEWKFPEHLDYSAIRCPVVPAGLDFLEVLRRTLKSVPTRMVRRGTRYRSFEVQGTCDWPFSRRIPGLERKTRGAHRVSSLHYFPGTEYTASWSRVSTASCEASGANA
jgi:hypothetical protein